jgi:hypothetical protein
MESVAAAAARSVNHRIRNHSHAQDQDQSGRGQALPQDGQRPLQGRPRLKSHILTKKSTKRKRGLRAPNYVSKGDQRNASRLLPYA